MFAILAETARAENEQRRERIMSGLDEARRKGVTLGRPKGSKMSPKDVLKKYPKAVKYINAGHSEREVARLAGVSGGTVQRVKRAMRGI